MERCFLRWLASDGRRGMAACATAVELVSIASMRGCLVSELPGFDGLRLSDGRRLRFEASVQRAARKWRINEVQEAVQALDGKDELGVGRVIALLAQLAARG